LILIRATTPLKSLYPSSCLSVGNSPSGIAEHGKIWAQGEYGDVQDWSKDSEGSWILDTGGLSGRPDLQAWLRDRCDAFDELHQKCSDDDLKKLEETAKTLFQSTVNKGRRALAWG
jgi:hypothetical protein